MADTRSSSIDGVVEIARSPREVFDYVADPTRLPEWQLDVVSAAFDEPAAARVGARGREVRHVMGSDRSISWEVTDYDPDQRYGIRGIDGPVRARVTMDMSPGTREAGTQLRYGIAFEGHGIGRLIATVARKGARKDLPAMLDRLKRRLEESTR
jgi:uncharacterized protein YndB with AHSA1/START domain